MICISYLNAGNAIQSRAKECPNSPIRRAGGETKNGIFLGPTHSLHFAAFNLSWRCDIETISDNTVTSLRAYLYQSCRVSEQKRAIARPALNSLGMRTPGVCQTLLLLPYIQYSRTFLHELRVDTLLLFSTFATSFFFTVASDQSLSCRHTSSRLRASSPRKSRVK